MPPSKRKKTRAPFLCSCYFPVIIAVALVRVVKVATYKVVDVIAVRHLFMSTIGVMLVFGMVVLTFMSIRAVCGVLLTYFNSVLIYMAIVFEMKMPIMQIIRVVPMANPFVVARI